MLSEVKKQLRISGNAHDSEVSHLIESAKQDLARAGAVLPKKGATSESTGDALFDRAIILYCKANFGYDEGAERFKEAFEHIKRFLVIETGVRG